MVKLPFNVVVLRHWREAKRATNSGQLITACISNAKVVDMQEQDYAAVLKSIPKGNTWLLFPSSEHIPSQKGLPWPLPDTIVVVDGKWSEASKMASQLKHLPRFTPLYGPHAADRLLARPHAEAQATAEGISSVVREVSSKAADCLDEAYAKFVTQAKKRSGSTAKKNPGLAGKTYAELICDLRELGRGVLGIFFVENTIKSCSSTAPQVAMALMEMGNVVGTYGMGGAGHYDLSVRTSDMGWLSVDPTYMQFRCEYHISAEPAELDTLLTYFEAGLRDPSKMFLVESLKGQDRPLQTYKAPNEMWQKVYGSTWLDYFKRREQSAAKSLERLDQGNPGRYTSRYAELLHARKVPTTKKNPTSQYREFKVGDRVRDRNNRSSFGTVKGQFFTDQLLIVVEWDSPATSQAVRQGSIEKIGPLEELAATGSAKKNPLTPKWPRGRLGSGTRVKVRGKQIGTILPNAEQPRNPDWYMVDIEGDGWRCLRRDILEPLSPLDELALTAKKNPKDGFNVGDRVQRLYGPWKTKVGTITSFQREPLGCSSTYTQCAIVLFDGARYAQILPLAGIKAVTPLEELASIKIKNNPQQGINLGDAVRYKHHRGRGKAQIERTGTITSISVGGWCRVHWDGFEPDNTNWLLNDMELIPPMEALAAVAKSYKNPNPEIRVGDRVRAKAYMRQEKKVGTVTAVHGVIVYVLVDGGKVAVPFYEHQVEIVSPLEELAAVGKTKGNPKKVFEVGDYVRANDKKWDALLRTGVVSRVLGSSVFVRFEGVNSLVFFWDYALEEVSPLEALAAVSNVYKNPFAPGAGLLRNGVRVRVRRSAGYGGGTEYGTVIASHGGSGWTRIRVHLDGTPQGTAISVSSNCVEEVSPLEELADTLPKAKKNPKLAHVEAKKQVLASLAGLPQRERIDGKCLLANTTLCGLAGGRLVVGVARHKQAGPVAHVWVVDAQGQVQDVLSAWYSNHKEDATQARVFGPAWPAAQDMVQDVASGVDVIAYWRRHRGV